VQALAPVVQTTSTAAGETQQVSEDLGRMATQLAEVVAEFRVRA
jgi:methyl-accepting chemotaxis protein